MPCFRWCRLRWSAKAPALWPIVLIGASPFVGYESQIRSEPRYLAGQIAGRGKTAVAVADS